MIIAAFKRYGLGVALALVVADLLVAYFVGTKLVEWELRQIRDAW